MSSNTDKTGSKVDKDGMLFSSILSQLYPDSAISSLDEKSFEKSWEVNATYFKYCIAIAVLAKLAAMLSVIATVWLYVADIISPLDALIVVLSSIAIVLAFNWYPGKTSKG